MARATSVFLLAILVAAAPSAPAQQVHKFPDQGFRISAPSSWSLIPRRPGEDWIVAHFIADRDTPYRDPVNQTMSAHRARLRVLAFPKRDSPVEVTVLEKTESRTTTSITYPYRDYEDYLKRNNPGGGYYVASSEKIIVGGVPVTREDVKVEKGAAVARRLMVCIYHLADRDLAVEADILESQVASSEEMVRSIKSLVITGEAKKPESAASRPGGLLVGDNMKDLVKKRDEVRRAWRERVLADVQKTLPKGWTSKKTKHFLVVSHASAAYTELLLWQANECREWLDQNLKDVGEGEVMRSVLRICASADEARAYASGSGDSYVWDSGEVVCAERSGSILGDFSSIASALLDQYLADRNPALDDALPLWLHTGLRGHVSGGRISKKESGLIFPPPIGALQACIKMSTEGRFIPADKLMRTEPDLSANDKKAWEQAGEFSEECELYVRYLLSGPGKTGRTKGLIQKTMAAAVQQLEALDFEVFKKMATSRPSSNPMTEEEEEAALKLRRAEGKEFAKKHRQERMKLLDELTGTVLRDWRPDDWTKLDKAFETWVKSGLK